MRIIFIIDTSIKESVPIKIYEKYGFYVDVFRYSDRIYNLLKCLPYSAAIYMTEAQDGTILKRWRMNGISMPVIVVSKPVAVSVRVTFLNAGADD
ncbi:hypothetical protein YL67_004533 [Salmonella enterica subsp. enterica]|nr:hypothetical protein [Salmonella enterica subsp. enterica serovar Javiana]EEK7980216.1 hypothetical protein [Salmonella enterica subsp. enterica serovar Javiana]EEK8040929.1 hypothetical protein [Salmonella enterica subsp. enterica serovar Javiana]